MPQRKSNDDDAFMAELSDIMMTPDDENPDTLMLRNMIWEELDKASSLQLLVEDDVC